MSFRKIISVSARQIIIYNQKNLPLRSFASKSSPSIKKAQTIMDINKDDKIKSKIYEQAFSLSKCIVNDENDGMKLDINMEDMDDKEQQTIFEKIIDNHASLDEKLISKLNFYVHVKKLELKGIMEAFKSSLENFNQKIINETNWQYNFVDITLKIYEALRNHGAKSIIYRAFLRALNNHIHANKKFLTPEIKQRAFSVWTRIEPYDMVFYINIFNLKEFVKTKDKAAVINSFLYESKQYLEAVVLMMNFGLFHQFNLEEIINLFIHEDKMEALNLLLDNIPERCEPDIHRLASVRKLCTKKHSSTAVDMIKRYKYDRNSFPELMDILHDKGLFYMVRSLNWMLLESNFMNDFEMLNRMVSILLSVGKGEIAFSIAKRHNLIERIELDKNSENFKYLGKKLENYIREMNKCIYHENILIDHAKDEYLPTEEIINESLLGTYIQFKDFKVNANDAIIFIGDANTKEFSLAKDELLNKAKVIGFDTESVLNYIGFIDSKISILQIATKQKIYIFDLLALTNSEIFKEFLVQLLSNHNITKIGHSTQSELNSFRSCLNINIPDSKNIMGSFCDIAKIYLKINPSSKKSNLAHICQETYKKPLSKFEQMSNWSSRPLRKAQLAYAAMDAFILIRLYEKFNEATMSKKQTQEISTSKGMNTKNEISLDDIDENKLIKKIFIDNKVIYEAEWNKDSIIIDYNKAVNEENPILEDKEIFTNGENSKGNDDTISLKK